MAIFYKRSETVAAIQWSGRLEDLYDIEDFIDIDGWGMDGEHLTLPINGEIIYVSPGDYIVEETNCNYSVYNQNDFYSKYDYA